VPTVGYHCCVDLMPPKPKPKPKPAATPGELIVYADDQGEVRIHVRLVDDTVWLTQRLMADLYGVSVPTINEHLANIYGEDELAPEATIRKFRIVRTEGNRRVSRLIDHYALPAILAVGYRVRSAQGSRFRQWATARLEEYLVKGFVLDDERLASGRGVGLDYFDELLERIRARADADQPHMGLTTWTRSPGGPIRKTDVRVAKNYLREDELRELQRIVGMYLDYAEDQTRRRRTMTMTDWEAKLDAFLAFNERNVLGHAGKVSHALAVEHAAAELERYQARQRALEADQPSSDFDRFVQRVEALGDGKDIENNSEESG